MKVRSPSIHITLESIDDLSLACINPPVNRKYASNFKSKLAKFVASIHQPTLMNIMEYLIKFKEWYLSVREGHASPVLLYEDLLIIGIFKVNQNQLMHTEMTLILAKLQELLGRSKRAIQVRCFNYLMHLTEEEINKAVLTDTDFVMIKDTGHNYKQIKVFAQNRQDWASSFQRREMKKRMKGQQSIGTIVGQRMAAIRMHYMNTLVYTQQRTSSLAKIMEEDTSNLQGSLINSSKNSIANSITFQNIRSINKKVDIYNEQTCPALKNKRYNPQINSLNTVDDLIEHFSQDISTKKINSIINFAGNKSVVKLVEDILKYYCEQSNFDNLSIRQSEKDNLSNLFNQFQQEHIKKIFVPQEDLKQQNNVEDESNSLMRAFQQDPNSFLQFKEQVDIQTINIGSNNVGTGSSNFNQQLYSFETHSQFQINSPLSRRISTNYTRQHMELNQKIKLNDQKNKTQQILSNDNQNQKRME